MKTKAIQAPLPTGLSGLMRDTELREEILSLAEDGSLGASLGLDNTKLSSILADPSGSAEFSTRPFSEAIVRLSGRPSLLVQNDQVTLPTSLVLAKRLKSHTKKFTPPLKSVGRVELVGHLDFEWIGTGWMIDSDIVVTNRHVAAEFARKSLSGTGYAFIRGMNNQEIISKIDFREEYRVVGAAEFHIERVLYISPFSDDAPDVAFLRVIPTSGLPLPTPIQPHPSPGKALKQDLFIACVGYPARDSRSEPSAMDNVFGDIYDVKRFAPGVVMHAEKGSWWFTHDCSTLGGNSGSLVLEIESGRALGLHFAGRHKASNYAVRIDTVLELLQGAKGSVSVPVEKLTSEMEEKVRQKASYTSKGYDEKFLGTSVPLPMPSDKNDLLSVKRGGTDPHRLDYMHFSVCMSKSRRLPVVTAVNIDGRSRKMIPRRGQTWFFDPRIKADQQIGKEFYGPTEFDRGHMVRREDPVWGPDAEAKLANEDTFHYTNACPQHPGLNQREWLKLEDYILDNADARDLKVSVFTGPVFHKEDPDIEGVKVPLRFWKIAALIDDETGKLAAAGYLLSQEDMVAIEFRYGRFKTYQVAISHIEEIAGISFPKAVKAADTFASRSTTESVPSWAPGIEIRRAEDVQFK